MLNFVCKFSDVFLVVKSRFKPNHSLKHYLEAGHFPRKFFKHGSIKDQPRDTQSIDFKIAHRTLPKIHIFTFIKVNRKKLLQLDCSRCKTRDSKRTSIRSRMLSERQARKGIKGKKVKCVSHRNRGLT